MTDIKKLAQQFTRLEEQLVGCIRCGMCQSVCPVFNQTRREADVARGKIALLNGLTAKIFKNPRGVNNRLNKCLLCGSCSASCPSGVDALQLFIKARVILSEYSGLSPVKKILFKQLLSKPKRFNALMTAAQKFQPLVSEKKPGSREVSYTRFNLPLIGHRNFSPLARTPFHKSFKPFPVARQNSSITVAVFTGCLIDKLLPDIAHAAIRALSYHNINLIVPENQGCCGIPALAAGDRKTFLSLADHHINLFQHKSFDYLVTSCATCTSTIKKLWPAFYRSNDARAIDKIMQLSAKTVDINQFLIDVIGVPAKKSSAGAVTYHDPCHLKKSLGIHQQPRQLITASGRKLKEMDSPDSCCGMGGSFNLFHYDISSCIGKLKQESIFKTGCQTVASGCPACIMQISDMLSGTNTRINVKHPVELYADSL